MILLYDLAAFGLLLLSVPYYGWRMLTTRKYRAGLKQRLGMYSEEIREQLSQGDWIWVHAVSLGEVNAVRPLLAELRARLRGHKILVSTVTDTGQARAKELPEVDGTIYLPLDVGFFLHRLLVFFSPRILIITETELWPRLVYSAQAKGVPVCLVNGRISDRSYPRYRRARFLAAATFRRMSLIGMQSEEDTRRAGELGAPPESLRTMGNLKFDSMNVVESVSAEECAVMRRAWGIEDGERVILGGSTWPGEEAALLDAYGSLHRSFAGLRLMIAPRHIERLPEVEALIRERDYSFLTRTGRRHTSDRKDIPCILLLDTTGELARTYALAEIAFVGKSLMATGGQNPLEPAAQGVAVCFGPHMENFRSIAPSLVEGGAACRVKEVEDLEPTLRALLDDPKRTAAMRARAREIVEVGAGAAARTAEHLVALLGK